jgi:hypothetical protein
MMAPTSSAVSIGTCNTYARINTSCRHQATKLEDAIDLLFCRRAPHSHWCRRGTWMWYKVLHTQALYLISVVFCFGCKRPKLNGFTLRLQTRASLPDNESRRPASQIHEGGSGRGSRSSWCHPRGINAGTTQRVNLEGDAAVRGGRVFPDPASLESSLKRHGYHKEQTRRMSIVSKHESTSSSSHINDSTSFSHKFWLRPWPRLRGFRTVPDSGIFRDASGSS